MLNLLNDGIRKKLISEADGEENKKRKLVSFEEFEVYKDRIKAFVLRYLECIYSKKFIAELPIFHSINIQKRIATNEASIYDTPPKRTFHGVTEDQAKIIADVYKDMKIDTALMKANIFFKIQEQAHLYIVPSMGRLKAKVMLPHQMDVVPSAEDTEVGECYLVNGFDRRSANIRVTKSGDSVDETIADEDDYQAGMKTILVWSPLFNFLMDEQGNIMSRETENPIGGVVPFVDIHGMKDGEYWVRSGQSLTDFTIQLNAGLTDLNHIVRMQGFSQAWYKGPANSMPDNIQVGPNFIIKLPIDPNAQVDTDFGFANPGSDITGATAHMEKIISMFLTSRGVDPTLVNSTNEKAKYASGFDRLLAMIDEFCASKTDFDVFEDAEQRIFNIVRAYLNTYAGTNILKYKMAKIPEGAYVQVEFKKPEAIMSEKEKLETIQQRKDLGIISRVEAVMQDRNINQEDAEKVLKEIDAQEALDPINNQPGNPDPDGDDEDQDPEA